MHSGKHQKRRIVKSTIHLQVQVGSRLVGVLLVGMNTHLLLIVRIFDRSIDLLFLNEARAEAKLLSSSYVHLVLETNRFIYIMEKRNALSQPPWNTLWFVFAMRL